ncbi:DUF4968 domain-containing protein [Psychrosphaera sp. F3M07]|uniref:glycoside hydrolase family 31 protein n=1 Tax=Psychrosphaera sp. F3M07 TaxID=2841560 RepID=UPI001C08C4DA|nr:TIM-barrel domain-containing protein [Psychrosphaera sp. F3M07]MBU2917846.1 DUF4968 domain-containing protein [Psychrosphaera sp. F3M07]
MLNNKKRSISLLSCWLLFCVSFISLTANAAEYINHKLANNKVVIQSDSEVMTITALTGSAFEVLVHKRNNDTPFPSFAIDKNRTTPLVPIKFTDGEDSLTFSSKEMDVVVTKSPLKLAFYKNGQLLLQEDTGYFNHNTVQGFRFKLDENEKLMGTGERVLGMNRRGHRLPLYNKAHYGYGTESSQMNFSIPAVMSDNKYILLFDNSANGWVDLAKSEADILQFEANGGRSSYIVFSGDDYPSLINNYVDVTGKQPLPPRWAFGNHASRFGYKTQQQVLDTIAQYKKDDIPVDSIILDLYWFGKDIKGHMGNLAWDQETFPQPVSMIDQLTQQGVKTVLITEPFILTSSSRWQEAVDSDVLGKNAGGSAPMTFDFYFGNTGLLDVFNDKTQQWFGDIYQELAKQGVAGVWGDLGEPEVHPATMVHTLSEQNMTATADEIHNTFGHQWAKLVNTALTEYQPNKRPFIIMRSGFAGSQRYGMIPWTGDVSRSWDGLKPQVELSLQMSLLGMAYTHSDLGGFAGGETFDQEMYIRWLQYGVFQPIYRPHAQDSIAPEPVFHDKQTKDIVREYIKLRYRMLPYNYTLAYQNTKTGMPLMRPMFFNDESNAALIDVADQYMWGESFLVKPITEPNLTSIAVNLPQGNWFDFWTGKKYQGNQAINYPLSLATIPVLIKAGAIIPTAKDMGNTEQYDSSAIKLDYYFDPEVTSSNAQFYDDDGISQSSVGQRQFELLNFVAQHQNINKRTHLNFVVKKDEKGLGYDNMPTKRAFELVVHNWTAAGKGVYVNGKAMAFMQSHQEFLLAGQGVYFNKANNTLIVKFNLDEKQIHLQLIK